MRGKEVFLRPPPVEDGHDEDDALDGYPKRMSCWGMVFFLLVACGCAAVLAVMRVFKR